MGDTSLQWRYLRPSGAKVMPGVHAAFPVCSGDPCPQRYHRWSPSTRCDLLLLQVKCIEFHPMQPWLGIADEDGNISVWDLHTQQLVYESKLATPDEVTFEDAMLQRAAEKEPDYFGPQLSHVRAAADVQGMPLHRKLHVAPVAIARAELLHPGAWKTGDGRWLCALSQTMHPPKVKVSLGATVKGMQFCDDETAFWQMASQHSQLHRAYSGSCHPHLGDCCTPCHAGACPATSRRPCMCA